MRFRPRPIPAEILPPDLPDRHTLIRRLYLDPLVCLTPPRPWAPLTDAEWAHIAPILRLSDCATTAEGRPGRPMASPRARLDAIFRAVTLKHPEGGRAPWRLLPAEFGKPDTISRTHRRWAAAGFWSRLLVLVADPRCPAVLAALTHTFCCAFRRAIRILGLRGLTLARRLRLFSALPAPSAWLPDADLSEISLGLVRRFFTRLREGPDWWPPRQVFRALDGLLRLSAGRSRLGRGWEPA